jgi:hypothetical protein
MANPRYFAVATDQRQAVYFSQDTRASLLGAVALDPLFRQENRRAEVVGFLFLRTRAAIMASETRPS